LLRHFLYDINDSRRSLVYYLVKITITTILIVAIAEIAKRSSFVGALLASVPLISVLAMVWLYIDTNDAMKVSALATSIFWLVLPSLALFVTLPLLLKQGVNFYLSISIAIAVTIGCYGLMVAALNHFGIKL
jgi:hypothetical protein